MTLIGWMSHSHGRWGQHLVLSRCVINVWEYGRRWSGKEDYESGPKVIENRGFARRGDTEMKRGFEMWHKNVILKNGRRVTVRQKSGAIQSFVGENMSTLPCELQKKRCSQESGMGSTIVWGVPRPLLRVAKVPLGESPRALAQGKWILLGSTNVQKPNINLNRKFEGSRQSHIPFFLPV